MKEASIRLSDIEIEFDYLDGCGKIGRTVSIASHHINCAQRQARTRSEQYGQMDHRGARVEVYFPSEMSEIYAFQFSP